MKKYKNLKLKLQKRKRKRQRKTQIHENVISDSKCMNIAMILSGRVTHYEKCLLPILKKTEHNVHLFISVNDYYKPYYDNLKKNLEPWLKKLHVKEYSVPDEFTKIYKKNIDIDNLGLENDKPARYSLKKVKKFFAKKRLNIPINELSMCFNQYIAFKLVKEYEKKHNIKYDCYMKFRADIFSTQLPKEITIKNYLYYMRPRKYFLTHGIYKKKCISSDWAWGNREIMEKYFDAYNYLLDKNKKLNGTYWCHGGENIITDVIYENNINIKMVDPVNIWKYKLIKNSKQPE